MNAAELGALRTLRRWTLRNRIRKGVRGLREPRYLIGLGAGIAYFGFLIGGQILGSGLGSGTPGPAIGEATRNLWALGLLAMMTFLSVSGPGSAGLQINGAEAQFLLAAPLSRQDLIRFKLAQRTLPLALSSAFFAVFTTDGFLWRSLAAWVGFFAVSWAIQLVRSRAAIYEADARRLGTFLLRRAPVLPAVTGVLLLLLLAHLLAFIGGPAALADPVGAFQLLPAWGAEPLPGLILAPIRPFIDVFTERAPVAWAQALAIVGLELYVLYRLVIRIDVPFEEASLESAVRRARILDAARRGSGFGALFARKGGAKDGRKRGVVHPTRFALPRRGPPELAFLWKNIAAFERHPLSRSVRFGPLVVFAFFIVVTLVTGESDSAASLTAIVLGVLSAYLLLVGPIAVRNDLRGDLMHLEMIRSYPVSGRAFVAASIAGSAATLMLVEAMIILLAVGFLAYSGAAEIPTIQLLGLGLAALAALAPLLGISLLLHNLAALYFPAWFRPGVDRGRGLETMGLRMVSFFGGVILIVLGLGVPGVIAALVAFAVTFPFGVSILPWGLIPGGIVLLFLLGVEIWVAIDRMGARWDRMDPAEVQATS